jgi:hypothetical protein
MPLYEPAAQLINYAREIAVMDEEQFRNHFNSMSDHLKMTLRQIKMNIQYLVESIVQSLKMY